MLFRSQRSIHPVGVTTRSIFSPISLALKKRIAGTTRRGKPGEALTLSDRVFNAIIGGPATRYREGIAHIGVGIDRKRGEQLARYLANVSQGERAAFEETATRALQDAMGKSYVSWAEKARVGFEMVWGKYTFEGERLTPGWVADQLDAVAQEIRATQAARKEAGRLEQSSKLNEAKRLEDQARVYRIIDGTRLDTKTATHDQVITRMREVFRPYAAANDEMVARELGISVQEVKRANYLRQLRLEGGTIERQARELKAAREAEVAAAEIGRAHV